MHDGHAGYGTEDNPKRVRLRRNYVAVLIGVAWLYSAHGRPDQRTGGAPERGGEPTDDGGYALVSGYSLFVVALAPLE